VETKGKIAKRQCQMDIGQNNRRGNKKLIPLFVTKQKGCTCTNGVEEHLNERHRGGPKPKTKGVNQGHHLLEEHEMSNNAFGDTPCHATKTMIHIWNKGNLNQKWQLNSKRALNPTFTHER
jgi:hypothetical protein